MSRRRVFKYVNLSNDKMINKYEKCKYECAKAATSFWSFRRFGWVWYAEELLYNVSLRDVFFAVKILTDFSILQAQDRRDDVPECWSLKI
jgi:hypothetical protein